MTQFLPPNLLALFAPRDPVPYLPPLDKLPHEKKSHPYSGVAHFLNEFEDPKDTPPPTRVETKDERKERKRKERAEQVAYKLEQDLALWDPVTQHPGDAYKSLFVARINYDTSESKLRREFEVYGPVKRITLVADKNTGKMRGYAFVEYEHERDMHSAYKHADGKKIDGRRVLVDIERGRTIKGWRPRRLGGGLGGTRKGGPDVNTKYSGRDDNPGAFGGRDDRSRSRERLPPRRRSRSPRERGEPRERRRRSRSRSRSRERPEREPRERERRRRSRSPRIRKDRSMDPGAPEEEVELVSTDPPKRHERERVEPKKEGEEIPGERNRYEEPRRRRRSRSRDRSRRSRSPRESKRRRRSRSRERKRRSRSRDRRGGDDRDQNNEYPPGEYGDGEYGPVQVKEEPENEYPGELGNNGDYYAQYTSAQPMDMDMETEYKEETIEPISEYGTAYNQHPVEN